MLIIIIMCQLFIKSEHDWSQQKNAVPLPLEQQLLMETADRPPRRASLSVAAGAPAATRYACRALYKPC